MASECPVCGETYELREHWKPWKDLNKFYYRHNSKTAKSNEAQTLGRSKEDFHVCGVETAQAQTVSPHKSDPAELLVDSSCPVCKKPYLYEWRYTKLPIVPYIYYVHQRATASDGTIEIQHYCIHGMRGGKLTADSIP